MTEIVVLIADDEELERRAIKKILGEMNELSLVLYEAENGREILERIQQTKIDIVLLDIKMPGLDGISIAKQINLLQPATHIVFVTAFSEFDYAREAIRLGVQDYLVKPVSRETVQETIAKVIQHIQTEHQTAYSSLVSESLLLQELEIDIGKGRLSEEKLLAYAKYRGMKNSQIYLIVTDLGCLAGNNKIVQENLVRKIKIYLKNSFDASGTIVLGNETEDIRRFYAVLLFREPVSEAALHSKFGYLVDKIKNQLGIKLHFTAMEWKGGSIGDLFMELCNYSSLSRDSLPLLVVDPKVGLSQEHVKGKLAKIMEYMRQHLAQNISLKEAAAVVGLSPFYVSHLFKTYQRETFVQVYTRLRIEAAKHLLKDNRYSVKEVCNMLGYNDQAYFSRVFKKHEGISPQEYQKSYEKDEDRNSKKIQIKAKSL